MTITRRSLILSAAAGAAALSMPSIVRAQPIVLKVATNTPETDPLAVYLTEAIEAIKAESNGSVELRLFPNNQLGSNTDVLSQVRSGGVEFFPLSPLILQTLVPNSGITGVGYAWSGYDKLWPAIDGDLGAYVRAEIAKSGLHTMETMWDNGFRHITSSNNPVLTADDLNGFKIRVPPSPLWTSLFQAFGAAPTAINFAEVYSALQTGIVDGQENPLQLIYNAKLFEVQDHLSLTNHMWDGYWILANGPMWEGLPEDVRALISKHMNESGLRQRDAIAEANSTLQSKLAESLEVHEVDQAVFRTKLSEAGFYSTWAETFGSEGWSLLEKHTGTLA